MGLIVLVAGGFSASASPRWEKLLEEVGALEESAVKLHQGYGAWLEETGQYEGRSEDALYASLCLYRNSCRTLASLIRGKASPQLCWSQIRSIRDGLTLLRRCQDSTALDPQVKELMKGAQVVAGSFWESYGAMMARAPEVVRAEVARVEAAAFRVRSHNPPRIGPLRLLPNRYDIMSFLENRWSARR